MSTPVTVKFDASMHFRFGRSRRAEVKALTCFDAVLSGERTSTTRFEEDSRQQYERWRKCNPGDIVRIWSGPWNGTAFTGRSCLIEITENPRPVCLTEVNREAWSRSEGWSPDFLDVLIGEGKQFGFQIFYRLHTPPDDPQGSLQFADAGPTTTSISHQ